MEYKVPEIVELITESVNERLEAIAKKYYSIEISGFLNLDLSSWIEPSSTNKAVISLFELQYINDVPKHLRHIRSNMNSGDTYICIFPGGSTFSTLRELFEKLDLEIMGGVSPRIAPMISIKDAGMLTQRAGFKNIVADSELIEIEYESFNLVQKDIASLGLANCLNSRSSSYLGKEYLKTLNLATDAKPIKLGFELISIMSII